MILFENLDNLSDPQCASSIKRHCIGARKIVYSLRCQFSYSILKKIDAQQRKKPENTLGTVLPE